MEEERKRGKTPQNCKSPMQRQRFMTTIKNVTAYTHMHILLSHFSRVQLCVTPQMAAHQAPRPQDSPGKSIGGGCHFLLQRMKVKRESEVVQPCPTLSDPMDCSLPGSSVHGIFQARVLEWGAIAFSICIYTHKQNQHSTTTIKYNRLT